MLVVFYACAYAYVDAYVARFSGFLCFKLKHEFTGCVETKVIKF